MARVTHNAVVASSTAMDDTRPVATFRIERKLSEEQRRLVKPARVLSIDLHKAAEAREKIFEFIARYAKQPSQMDFGPLLNFCRQRTLWPIHWQHKVQMLRHRHIRTEDAVDAGQQEVRTVQLDTLVKTLEEAEKMVAKFEKAAAQRASLGELRRSRASTVYGLDIDRDWLDESDDDNESCSSSCITSLSSESMEGGGADDVRGQHSDTTAAAAVVLVVPAMMLFQASTPPSSAAKPLVEPPIRHVRSTTRHSNNRKGIKGHQSEALRKLQAVPCKVDSTWVGGRRKLLGRLLRVGGRRKLLGSLLRVGGRRKLLGSLRAKEAAGETAQGWRAKEAARETAQGWRAKEAAGETAQGWRAKEAARESAQGWRAKEAAGETAQFSGQGGNDKRSRSGADSPLMGGISEGEEEEEESSEGEWSQTGRDELWGEDYCKQLGLFPEPDVLTAGI
ncbi:hypothetical protein CEUSTIGMA_g4412.t1 [Chlamydomonas eustigma]|uniref:Uncharacterized protein n=1 Tax=Chlamydomonas eustigma TaxID=1157962 RepID=A0A250X1N3_9CHLO|nr:hypothetical protein CEUSTIGMA_g4412.t1 [Chlamydomonas eustigma]|eukprot:GAX76965.1 hypothetical protein CEUSTIGMA_g4412.t1 [Chlamydomonas eustigma]